MSFSLTVPDLGVGGGILDIFMCRSDVRLGQSSAGCISFFMGVGSRKCRCELERNGSNFSVSHLLLSLSE